MSTKKESAVAWILTSRNSLLQFTNVNNWTLRNENGVTRTERFGVMCGRRGGWWEMFNKSNPWHVGHQINGICIKTQMLHVEFVFYKAEAKTEGRQRMSTAISHREMGPGYFNYVLYLNVTGLASMIPRPRDAWLALVTNFRFTWRREG